MPKSLPIACGGWLFEAGALPFALELQAILFCVLRGRQKVHGAEGRATGKK